jgi:dihydrofolate reductase
VSANVWRDTTRVVPRTGARAAVAALKGAAGGDPGDDEILVFGSRTLWHGLLADDLVDELHVFLGAALLGGGTPAFPAGADAATRAVRLLETRRFDGSESLVLRYAVASGSA